MKKIVYFLCSHEPCSLCLKCNHLFQDLTIFYYFFPYDNSTSNEFSIPHDLKILKEVFKVTNGEYNKENSYWRSDSIHMLLIEKVNLIQKNKNL